jgi:hypothetical protein
MVQSMANLVFYFWSTFMNILESILSKLLNKTSESRDSKNQILELGKASQLTLGAMRGCSPERTKPAAYPCRN